MATAPMTGAILPQYQGDYLTLQNKQQLAQALMGNAIQNQASQIPTNMPVMPKFSLGAGLTQLGQAYLAAKLGNDVAQGYRKLGNDQWAAFGGSQASPQTVTPADDPTAQAYPVGPSGTPSQASASTAPQVASQPAPQGSSQATPMNPLGMNPAMAYSYYAANPGEYFKTQAQAYKPADIVAKIRAAGIDPNTPLGRRLAQDALAKDNYIAPIEGRPNGWTIYPDGRQVWNPNVPNGGMPVMDAQGNFQGVAPLPGAAAVTQAQSTAQAAGPASFHLEKVWNPKTGQYEYQPATNIAGAATPGQQAIVQTESGGNPNAVSPKGAQGAWQVMPNTSANPGYGVTPARDNSPAELNRVGKDYYNAMSQRYGDPTLGAIAYNMGPDATDKWIQSGAQWEKLPQETRNYVGKVSTLTALNSLGSSAASNAPGPMAAEPPLAAKTAAEGLAQGQIDTMQKSYQGLQAQRAGGNSALQDIGNMMQLAQGKYKVVAGDYMADLAGLFSSDAKEYEKSRDNLVTRMGSQLGMNTDAARSLVYGSIPGYGAPKQAIQNGLQTLKGQVQLGMIKANYLGDAYANGDPKSYNRLENQFDQNMSPMLASIVSLPPSPERTQMLNRAAQDPTTKTQLTWAINSGILK